MIKFIKSFFGKKEEVTAEAPYKVEQPAQTYESLKPEPVTKPVAEQAAEAVVKSIAPAKKPRAKKPTAPKVAKPKAPRKPKAPK